MPQQLLAPGLSLTYSSEVEVSEGSDIFNKRADDSSRRRRSPANLSRPRPEQDLTPLLRELDRQGFQLVSDFTVAPRATRAGGRNRRAASLPGLAEPTIVNMDLLDDEDAVVMTIDEAGELDWVFSNGSRLSSSAKRASKRASSRGGTRTVRFEIPAFATNPVQVGGRGRRNRLKSLGKRLVGWVFKLVRNKVTGLLIRHLEKRVKKGLVLVNTNVPSEWSPLGEQFVLPVVRPSGGAAPRVLLLVHGTFSSTVGSFGSLAFTEPGLNLLNTLQGQYDYIIGWDHYTLSDTPAENAAEILVALERAFPKDQPRPEIDAIAFSRGGLVLRTLLEQQLADSHLKNVFRRSVFVACTLGGTKLAQRENWKHHITIISNLAIAACRGVAIAIPPAAVAAVWVETVARGVATLVNFLATSLINDEAVPGLSAMDPHQKVVKNLNQASPPAALLARYRAISNDFEPDGPGAAEASEAMPAGLKLKLWDLVADAQMRGANDLVVHTSSMCTVAGSPLPDAHTLALPQNGRTMHTMCFRDVDVIAQVREWLVDHGDVDKGSRATRRAKRGKLLTARQSSQSEVATASKSEKGSSGNKGQGLLAVLHAGETVVEARANRAIISRLAGEWSYTLRQRSRWAHDEDLRNEVALYAVDTLSQLGVSGQQLKELANASRVQVELFDAANGGGVDTARATSEFPWEYVLTAATRELGRHQPVLITRLLRGQGRRSLSSPSKAQLTVVISAPGRIGDIYSFHSEVSRLEHAVGATNEKLAFPPIHEPPSPTLGQLREQMRDSSGLKGKQRPRFVHVSGVDPNQASTLVPGIFDQMPSGTPDEGLLVAGEAFREEVVGVEALAEALVPEESPPELVTLNLHYSGAHTAREMVRRGARASLGFMDAIPDEVAEYFFTVFYAECHREETMAGIPHAFQRTWAKLAEQGHDLHGTGIVLWLSETVSDHNRKAPSEVLLESDRQLGLAESRVKRMADVLAVDVAAPAEINYSLLHNQRSALSVLTLSKLVSHELDDVRVEVELDAGGVKQVFRRTYTLREPHSALADDIKIPLTAPMLRSLRERLQTTVYTRVTWEGRIAHESTRQVAIAPVDEWHDDTRNNPWLPSFVLPRDRAVARVIGEARKYLVALTDDPNAGFDGYQRVSGEDPSSTAFTDLQVRAIWTALVNDRQLLYINPPPAYSKSGQRLRTPSEVLQTSSGTCIDLSLLLAACLEYVDIHACLVLLTGHCFVGYWRAEDYHSEFMTISRFPRGGVSAVSETARRSPIGLVDRYGWRLGPQCFEEIQEHMWNDELRMLEATGICFNYSFANALVEGEKNMKDRAEFDSMIDIYVARRSTPPVTPLPIAADEALS
jgi:hypothetical protein